MPPLSIDPWIAAGVLITTAITDACYVRFTTAVASRRRLAAANWGGLLYLISGFAVISYTHNWFYLVFAAVGSWIGAYVSMTFMHRAPIQPPPAGSAPPI
jgi:hypothetical protein